MVLKEMMTKMKIQMIKMPRLTWEIIIICTNVREDNPNLFLFQGRLSVVRKKMMTKMKKQMSKMPRLTCRNSRRSWKRRK